MQYTTNYNIPKYDATDLLNPTSREGINSGNDIIDNQLKTNADAIGTKANSSDVYAKSQTYSKTEVDTALGTKVGKSETYTSSEKKAICNTIGAEYDGQFELIEETTLTEATLTFIRTTEPNSTPYNFKNVRIELIAPALSTNYYIDFKGNDARVGYSLTTANQKFYYICMMDILNGKGKGLLLARNSIGENASVSISQEFEMLTANSITKVYIGGLQSIQLPIGTTIKIYGVRA